MHTYIHKTPSKETTELAGKQSRTYNKA